MNTKTLSLWISIFLLLTVTSGFLAGCSTPAEKPALPTNEITEPTTTTAPSPTPTAAPEWHQAHSAKTRNLAPSIDEAQLQELAAGNRAFAVDLYQATQEGAGNLFFSPYSISLALAMTYGGARGETAQQMAETLHFMLPDEKIHAGFNALDLALTQQAASDEGTGPKFKLNIANSVWAQYDYEFQPAYLDLIGENYGVGLYLTDFVGDTEGSRQAINEWVSQETEGKIEDLLPEGVLDNYTRLVLANAIYFNARWRNTFNENVTEPAPFNLLDGTQVSVPMMDTTDPDRFGYLSTRAYQAVELPYQGGQVSMIVIMPTAGEFEAFEADLTPEKLAEIADDMRSEYLQLRMPKFSFEAKFRLAETLQTMGMVDAFDADAADFSGIDGTDKLLIRDVIHQGFVAVDEKGTEAAAATAVIVAVESMPEGGLVITLDHPFIFLIQEKDTGTILFLGRVLNPVQ